MISCEKTGVMELQVHKKYPLEAWPDSYYVANLDSFADTVDKVEKQQKKANTAISLQNNIPFQSVNPDMYRKMFGKPPHEKKQDSLARATQPTTPHQANTPDDFVEQFSQKITLIRQNPSSTALTATYMVQNEKNIYDLLKTAYGSKAEYLPTVLVRYQLKGLNPNIQFDALQKGDTVVLPKL